MQEIKLQFAVFFKDIEKRPDTLWYGFADELKNVMEGVPTILPVPMEAPLEIPIVQTKSKDETYMINIARNRADFIIKLIDKSISKEQREYLFKLFLSEICRTKEIVRVGIVEEVVFGEISKGVKAINEKYFCGKQEDAVELSLRKNSNLTVNGYKCNNIIDVASVPVTNSDGQQEEGFVRISRDINNVIKSELLPQDGAQSILNYALNDYTEQKFKELII